MLIPKKARWPKKKKAQHPEIELTVEEAGELDWQEQILTAIAGMKSDAFERLSQRILRRQHRDGGCAGGRGEEPHLRRLHRARRARIR